MPQLLDPRWEKACQLRAQGGEVKASYEGAGFTGKGSGPSATRFFKRDDVRARIAEIQDDHFQGQRKATEIAVKKAGLEESWIIERVKYAVELALRGEPVLDAEGRPTGQFSGKRNLRAAIDGLRLASDFKAMRIQRHEVGQPGDFARMSDDELDASLADQARALGLPETAVTRLLELRANDDTVQ